MLCLVEIPLKATWHRGRGKDKSMHKVEFTQSLVTMVHRVAQPYRQSKDQPFVWVDAFIPEDRRDGIPVFDDRWIKPGIYRCKAPIKRNRKTLAPFLESGLKEMDVREAE